MSLEFHPVHAEDYERAAPIMASEGYNSTESSFVILYTWCNLFNAEIALDGDTVFVRAGKGDKVSYLPPLCGDMKTSLEKIYKTEKAAGRSPRFHSVTARMREAMDAAFPGEFTYTENRNSFDYIYSREALATLTGKKLNAKRNRFNKFIKSYEGRYTYSNMTADDIPEVLKFQQKWISLASDKDGMNVLEYETTAIERLLSFFEKFSLRGGVLRVDGELCAYCIGAKISENTLDVMVEKGDYAFDGVYQAINKFFCENNCGDVEFINREEDMGVEGLRRAKLSYQPQELLVKYSAVWKR